MRIRSHSAWTLALLGLLGACSGSDSGTAPAPLDIAGLWNQGARLADTVNGQTHIHTGYFSFSRHGAGFSGQGQQTGLCHGAAGDYTGPLATGIAFPITAGVQTGDHVAFQSDLCSYEGTLSADGAHIAGTMRCAYRDAGTDFVWTGDWLANREP
jgi:hypothetical protein